MRISDFCKKHGACKNGEIRASKFNDMDDFFMNSTEYTDVIWAIARKDVLTEKEMRLFACWCVRQIWHLLKDDRSKTAIIIAEKYAKGEATKNDLKVAAYDAAAAVAYVAYDAAAVVADAYAADAAAYATTDAADDAAAYAAYDAADDAAAADEAKEAQLKYLRENVKPNWETIL